MSTATVEPIAAQEENQLQDFVLSYADGKVSRYQTIEEVPEGAAPVTLEVAQAMTLEDLGKLYGAVSGSGFKKFKTKAVAVESLAYQVQKLPISGLMPEVATPAADSATSVSATKAPKVKKVGKTASRAKTLILTVPTDSEEKLKKLAPQAREVVAILAELAAEVGGTTLTGEAVSKKMNEVGMQARLKTTQEPPRILGYYVPRLKEAGFIVEQQ
jgi:hypothetical protein